MGRLFRRLRARLKYWNNPEQVRREIDAHRELAIDAARRGGASARESRWRAARLLGNDTVAREDARAVWVARWRDQALQDLRYALRTLRREWGFAITASLTLAVGFGVLVGVFTVFNAIFLRPWPVPRPARVFGITVTPPGGPLPDDGTPHRIPKIPYVIWNAVQPQMTSADLVAKRDVNVTFRANADRGGKAVTISFANDTFLETLGIALQMGTWPADGREPAIAISHGLWQSAFAGDRDVVGRRVWLGNHPAVVTGVLEERFRGFPPRQVDGFAHIDALAQFEDGAADFTTSAQRCCIDIYGRLRAGATRAQAASEIAARTNAVQSSYGLPAIAVTPWDTRMASRDGLASWVPRLFALLFAGCGVVTLLACANIGNLQLARGLRRTREIAVRLSLGANRGRIVRQLLTESAVIAAIGMAGGLAISWTLPVKLLGREAAGYDVSPDPAVIAFAAIVAVAATVIAGLAPALRVTRIEWRRAGESVAGGAGRLRGILLASQVALSLALIASASLLSRGALRAASGANAGFTVDDISTLILAVRSGEDASYAKGVRADVEAALQAIPRIGLADRAPWEKIVTRSGVVARPGGGTLPVQAFGLSASAVSLLEIPVLEGRVFSDDGRLHEAIVSRSLARQLWGENAEAIGRQVIENPSELPGLQEQPVAYTVVGVIGEVQLTGVSDQPAMITARVSPYLPTVLAPRGSEARVTAAVNAVAPRIRVIARPLVDSLRKSMEGSLMAISVASGLGAIALLLASLGIFGVFAYVVEERRREIGVRLALGATRADIRRSVAAAVRVPLAGGLAVGLGLALVAGALLRRNLFGLSVLDPWSYAAVTAILGAAACAATFLPLRRAVRVDPAVTLRQE